MMESHLPLMAARNNNNSYSIKKHRNSKEAYTDRSKIKKKKVGFATVFTDIIRREVMFKEAFISTAKITAIKITLKMIRKRENKR